MFHAIWMFIRVAVIIIIAAFVIIIALIAGNVISFILILMAVGVLAYVILNHPDDVESEP